VTTFECRTQTDAPPATVFDLARDIDSHVRSQTYANERAVAGVTSGLIGLGESVTWRATHFRIPFKMTSHIVEFDSPRRFVDEQIRGPFKRIRHEHVFEPSSGGTLMVDHVSFDAPLWFIGALVDRVILRRYMQRLIEDRAQVIKAEAEQGA
jgi:ligand-binding SRPBCC domain-containing protein